MDGRPNKRAAEEIAAEILKYEGVDRFREANRLCGDDAELRTRVFVLLEQADSASQEEDEFAGLHDRIYGEKYKVGSFSLERLLGSGGNGDVYLAVRTKGPKQRVAIKFLRPLQPGQPRRNEEFRKRFARELQLLAMLDHPYIVKLFDARNYKGRPYFVMEYVDGPRLDVFAKENRLSVAARIALFLKICQGVEHLENNLVVHRDLKPGNVLVDSANNPKILDFGISKSLRSELLDGEMITEEPIPPLTRQYASPEQWRNARTTAASDVYSLAVILYQLLTGQFPVPFSGDEPPADYVTAVCEGRSLPASQNIAPAHFRQCRESSPETLKKKLRGDLDAILAKALRVDVNERYPSVRAFSDDIERYLRFEPVRARQGAWAYRLRRFVRRNRGWILSVGAVLLALSIGLGLALWQRREALRQEQAAIAQAQIKDKLAREFRAKADRLEQMSGRQLSENTGLQAQLKTVADEMETFVDTMKKNGEIIRGDHTPDPKADALLGQSYALLGKMRTRSGEIPAAQQAFKNCLTLLNRAQREGDETLSTINAKRACQQGFDALRPRADRQ